MFTYFITFIMNTIGSQITPTSANLKEFFSKIDKDGSLEVELKELN